jgi:hypothetical protein
MDPNANYNRQLELAQHIQAHEDSNIPIDPDHASELASLVIELAIWVNSGGFVPKRFER